MNKRTRMAASVLILCLLVSLMYGCSGTPSSSITSSPAPEVTAPAASATVKPTAEATTAPAVTPGKEDTPPPTEEELAWLRRIDPRDLRSIEFELVCRGSGRAIKKNG